MSREIFHGSFFVAKNRKEREHKEVLGKKIWNITIKLWNMQMIWKAYWNYSVAMIISLNILKKAMMKKNNKV